VHTTSQTKTKTVGQTAGNYSVKSIIWRSNAIADSLNVTLSVLPWQITGEELVSKADFDGHKHDQDYAKKTDFENHSHSADDVGAYSKAESDSLSLVIDVNENKPAVTVGNRLHVFTAYADLQIPNDAGTSFRFVVDDVVDLSGGKCRLFAPSGQKISVTGTESDIANIKDAGVIHQAVKVSGSWKV